MLGGAYMDIRQDLKQILDAFVGLWMRDPDLLGYTHVRAEFGMNDIGTTGVEWKLIEADKDTIYREKQIFMGEHATFAVEYTVRPYWKPGVESGRLTFRLNPPAVSLDLFDIENTTLVAEFIIDEGKLV